jgi:hypothetical protein
VIAGEIHSDLPITSLRLLVLTQRKEKRNKPTLRRRYEKRKEKANGVCESGIQRCSQPERIGGAREKALALEEVEKTMGI